MKEKIFLTICFLAIFMVCFSIEKDSLVNSNEKSKFNIFEVNQDFNYSLDNNLKSGEANYHAKNFTANIESDFKRIVFYGNNKSKLNIHFRYLYEIKHIDNNIAIDLDEKSDRASKLKDDIELSQYDIKLMYERYKFSDSRNNSSYIGFFANLRDGQNRFSREAFKRFDVNLNLKNGTLIFGKVYGRINKYYEIYWNNRFEEILNNANNSETLLGTRLDYKSVSIEYKNLYSSEYHWRMRFYNKFSMGLNGNFEKYLQFSQKIQSRMNLEFIGGLSFCEKWEDRIGLDLQLILDYEIFKKIFGKKINYNFQAIYESIKFFKEMPFRIITNQNINMKFDISKHFSVLPKVDFKANWYKESHSGVFYISTYDDFSYSSNSPSLFMIEFSLNILYQF